MDFQKIFGCWYDIDTSHQSEPELHMPGDCVHVKHRYLLHFSG